MNQAKEQWASRAGFIFAAVGSAIGLGNIWRYPYVAYENGGGAFLIPYFFALLTAGIPILLLEYSLGHRFKGSAPLTYRRLSKKFEWLGWWQALLAFAISTYYMIILGWALSYTYFSFGTQWGKDTEKFFLNNYLGITDSFWNIGGIQWKVLIPVFLLWAFIYFVMRQQAHKGIERLTKILMPILIVMMIIITIRGVSLSGASAGLNVLLTPDFGALSDFKVWIAAYSQIFFSLSIGYATMLTYSSYLSKDTDLSNSGLIAALGNSGFEFMAALGVFGALGYLATQQGIGVDEVATGGVGLAFIVFPKIINQFPGLNDLFGVLFFGSLVFAGLTSIVSLLEPGVAAIRDKFNISRNAAVNTIVGGSAFVSILYATKGGLNYLDVIDHFLNNYGLLIGGFFMTVATAWFAKEANNMRAHINNVSDVHIGSWWIICVKYLTPALLLVMAGLNIIDEFKAPYGGFPYSGLISMGWGALFATLIGGFLLQAARWKEEDSISGKIKEGA
ncbi:sodium-dependent transporter [Salinithrix halophila]|uniref:Sodium-dependent transporter n=1 Tax=Salinithrix halophila TaxID=1485204 RepID=A0ABV8JB47_9BACL